MVNVVDKERQALDPKLREILEREKAEDKDYLYCGMCSNVITRGADRIEANGSHDHVLTNPHGFEFHLACFSEALGCSISGQRTAADTWFPGFEWRLATCAECQQHLGWYFDKSDQFFYGLIVDRLQGA